MAGAQSTRRPFNVNYRYMAAERNTCSTARSARSTAGSLHAAEVTAPAAHHSAGGRRIRLPRGDLEDALAASHRQAGGDVEHRRSVHPLHGRHTGMPKGVCGATPMPVQYFGGSRAGELEGVVAGLRAR